MRKLFIFLLGVMLSAQTVYSQPVIQTWTEDFDNIVSATSAPPGFTTIPQGSWVSDPVHYLPGSSVANPKSFLGLVPTTLGSTTILQTPVYDLSNMTCVLLRFSHICKVSPKDSALLQYRDVAGPPVWTTVRADAYLGKAATVARGFSASSYPEWQAGDSMAIPDQSWWKEEYFDLSQVASYGRFEFRFIIKRMNVQGTQASYGWLLENFELTASPVQIYPPVVEFIAPLVKDNVYYTGPFEINARVKTQTNAPIVPPKLVYTSTFNGTSVTDSVPMTNVLGDSLWKADIPQFVLGTQVTYYITGRDTLGNQASDTSGFVIMYGTGGNVIVGTGTTNNYYTPINLWYQYSWTRQLYLGSELIPGAMGGIISKLAWDYNYTNAWTVTKQTCYFRAVDETTQATGYIDPLADGATEVWSGTLSVAGGPAWVEITLDQPFFLPQDKNLLIYWHHESGNYPGSAWVFRHHTTASNQTVYAMSTVSFPATSAGTVTTARPNARFTIVNTTVNNHSVELSSIDMSDTVIVTPSVSVPVVATIKNKGASNLTSARIYYSVNGNTPQYFTWSGNLSWDYTTQASNASATYVPKVNGWDTLTIWVSLPNGQNDPVKYDDTLVKMIYGSSDMVMEFVYIPADTVNNTGPFNISARIITLSGANVGSVSLAVTTTYNSIPNTVPYTMTYHAGTGLYQTTIPHTRLGSDVAYSITKTDSKGNTVSIANSFYIRPSTGTIDTSVALVAVNTPEAGGQEVGTIIPINITLRNKGVHDLTDCDIHWTVNGGAANGGQEGTYHYQNLAGLPEDFTATFTIGNYTAPALGLRDTIWVKVNMPNGIADPSTTDDDSLSIYILGCSGNLAGLRTVGTSGDFSSIANAIAAIRDCGLAGDLTLQLKGSYAENINLANLTSYLRGYHLTITSLDNHADSAVINPASGVGVTLNNSNNIRLQKITVDVSALTTNAVQFTGACTNVVIRDCKLLANPTTTSSSPNPVYKAASTGVVDSIFVINNILNGGYAGFHFNGGTGTGTGQYGTHVVLDSNTISNNYYYGIRSLTTDFIHIAHNTITSRSANSSTRWDGISIANVNGDIIGNRVIQKNPAVAMDGFNLQQYNYYLTTKRALFANNELIYISTQRGTGLYTSWVNADIVHNSFYMETSGEANGLYLEAMDRNNLSLKNNNIVTSATSGDAMKWVANGYTNQCDMDYNNFYAIRQTNKIGSYAGTALNTIADLQQRIPTNLHAVSVMPDFIDPTSNTELLTNIGLGCSLLSSVPQDILGISRTTTTAMGCYEKIMIPQDLMLRSIDSWSNEIVNNQTVNVAVAAANLGTAVVTQVTFGWSLNGTPMPDVPWTASPSMASLEQRIIPIGQFPASNADNFEVVVWIKTVNGIAETVKWNDTASASSPVIPIASFVPPLAGDTVYSNTFDVYARIPTITGAPVSTPKLMLATTTANGRYILYDSVVMINESGDLWKVTVPQQYYNSNVVYSLTISDALGYSHTCIDSTYILFVGFAITDTARTIGTGTSTSSTNPYYTNYNFSYTRNYYMDYEISPNRTGGFIRSIAFYNTSTGASTCDNISFYLKAASDSLNTSALYIDPVADGATLVWGSATNVTYAGWNVFVLDAPFYLPPNKNLLIYCNNQDGSYTDNGTIPYWRYTATTTGRSCYAYADGTVFPPTGTSSTNGNRPNLQIDIFGGSTYQGNNLALLSALSPISDPNNICSDDYVPVQVVLANMGENDYVFTQDSITIGYEIADEVGHTYTGLLTFNTDTFASQTYDTIEVMSALPILYAGTYNIKVWVTSPIDNIVYDDTLYHTYISSRIGLPIDEDFSNADLPIKFVSTPLVGNSTWNPHTPLPGEPQPLQGNGTGVLRFDGTGGAMSVLSTRQLDLYGSVQPQLIFWYYHDTTLPFTDMSYLDVNAVVGGVSTNLAQLFRRRDTGHGWQEYTISLNQFTSASQCFLIQFEAMNKSVVPQYIDRIIITSEADLEVSGIVFSPDVSVCDMNNKEVKAVIHTTTGQAIDFSAKPTTVEVNIQGTTYSVPLQGRTLAGSTYDTITVASGINLSPGNYTITAYVATPVDNNPLDDTAKYVMDIEPELSVSVTKQSGTGNCVDAGTGIKQPIVITNTGNVALSNLRVRLSVLVGSSLIATVEGSIPQTLNPGNVLNYELNNEYFVPWELGYSVSVEVMGCDTVNVYARNIIAECANTDNLEIISINNPSGAGVDTIGTTIPVTITLKNRSALNDFRDIKATMVIRRSNDVVAGTPYSETLPFVIEATTEAEFTFSQSYTVPNDTSYSIVVYITDVFDNYLDHFHADDTIRLIRRTNANVGIGTVEQQGISLSQNIPNPANDNTVIHYSVPTDGSVIFNVYSISGQVLYSRTVETSFGAHSIELNTSDLAAGLYFYSMEFKGQRLVKRMVVEN